MKFWQAITWFETEQLPEIARFAEELGKRSTIDEKKRFMEGYAEQVIRHF